MTSNQCVFGLAAGYHFGDVRPFLISLRRSGFSGRCVLFVSETTRDTDQMAFHGAEIVPFSRPAAMEHVPYNAYRYFLYKEYLAQSPDRFEHVLLTDVRDVIFQRPPFDYLWPKGLNCTLEDRRMTVGECPHNEHWIRGHQGDEVLEVVSQAPISCSGTTVGDHESICNYLDTLTEKLLPFKGGQRMAGYDQGVHNVLLHTGAVDATLHDNAGPIMTLGYTRGEPDIDQDGWVLNEAGERAHIVHQYDRKPKLFSMIRKRYA